jgi:hypothetical protein
MNMRRSRSVLLSVLLLFGVVCNTAAEGEEGFPGASAVAGSVATVVAAVPAASAAPCSEPIIGRLDFAPETPEAADVVVRIVHQLSFGFAAGMIADGGMGIVSALLGLLFSPLFLVTGETDEIIYEMAHYATLGSHVALYPLFVTVGVNAVGEVEGIRGSGLTPLFAYLGVGVGLAVYMAGYPEVGTAAMFALPLIGAVGGFHLRIRPIPIEQKPETKRRKALAVGAGSLLGGSAYLSTRIFYPMMVEPEGQFFESLGVGLEGTIYDWLLMIPAASSLGAISTGRVVNRPGSWLLAAAGGMAGSLLGWGTTIFMDTPYIVPAVFLAAAGSTIGYLVWTPPRKSGGADPGMVSWNMMGDQEGRVGFNLRCSY